MSTAWGIGHVGLPFSERGRITVFGLELPLPEDTTFVASLRPGVGALHLRVEEFAPSEGDAAQTTAALGTLVELIQAVPVKVTEKSDKVDADAVREFAASMKIEQHKDRVVLTATVPLATGEETGRAGGRVGTQRFRPGCEPGKRGWAVKTGPSSSRQF